MPGVERVHALLVDAMDHRFEGLDRQVLVGAVEAVHVVEFAEPHRRLEIRVPAEPLASGLVEFRVVSERELEDLVVCHHPVVLFRHVVAQQIARALVVVVGVQVLGHVVKQAADDVLLGLAGLQRARRGLQRVLVVADLPAMGRHVLLRAQQRHHRAAGIPLDRLAAEPRDVFPILLGGFPEAARGHCRRRVHDAHGRSPSLTRRAHASTAPGGVQNPAIC